MHVIVIEISLSVSSASVSETAVAKAVRQALENAISEDPALAGRGVLVENVVVKALEPEEVPMGNEHIVTVDLDY
jgi:hypothetical protein